MLSPRSWREAVRDAFLLGEERRALRRRNVLLTAVLVAVGLVGTIALGGYANLETILAASLFAGIVLRGAYVPLVPILTVLLHNAVDYTLLFRGTWGLTAVAGLTVFLVLGYLFVSFVGTRTRPATLFRTRSVAVATTVSVPLTIAWDVWTAFGEWQFIHPQTPLLTVLELQVPFTLMHLISSLIFVPLIGFGLGYYVEHAVPDLAASPSPRKVSEQGL